MDQLPPPPGRPAGGGGYEDWQRAIEGRPTQTPKRPLAVTIAGWLLIVAGALAALAAVLILLSGAEATVEGVDGDVADMVGVVALVAAGLEVLAGVLILRRSPAGRVLGIVLSALGVLAGLSGLSSGQGIIPLAVFGFVLYALITNREAFRGRAA